MTKDELLKQAELREQTAAAIRFVAEHGLEKCFVDYSIDGENWYHALTGDWLYVYRHYRATLKPQPKLVPWESIDDVPLTHVFRIKGSVALFYSIQVASGIWVKLDNCTVSHTELFHGWEHAELRDKYSEMVWLPCGKEVVE